MKLNSLGVDHHKFFFSVIDCDMALVKSIVKLLPNTLWHVSHNIILGGSDSLFKFLNVGRKREDIDQSLHMSP